MKPSSKIVKTTNSLLHKTPREGARQKINPDWSDYNDEFECNSLMDGIVPSIRVRMAHSRKVFLPPTDIIELESSYCIRIEIAGLRQDQFSLEWKGQDLKVHGYREEPASPTACRYHQFEILYGAFERIFRMPANVDQNNTTAQYKDGILEITVPKRNAGKTINIPIKYEE
jgi:HSP20 family protein